MRKLFAAIGLAGCVVALASCSQPDNNSVAHQETVDHGTVVDEHRTKSRFTVIDEKGQAVELKLEDGSALFVAHWCPHCHDYLQSHEPIPGVRVVAVFPMEGETAEAMMERVRRKLDEAGWGDVPLYGSMDPYTVEGVPTIAYMAENVPYHRNAFEVGEGDL